MNAHNPIKAVLEPRPVLLSQFSSLRREPTRPAEFRGEDFDAKFDHDTLFFDVFRRPDGRVMLLGPPLFNLKPTFARMRIRSLPSGTNCAFRLLDMDRHLRVIVDAPVDDHALAIETDAGSVETAIGASLNDRFAGRRVLVTESRNNQFNWIADWIRFGRDRHGADAVLIYDNNSSLYSPSDLRSELAKIEGIAALEVVNWPFKFGPQGLDAKRFWDSDFCQMGALEHARWLFLQRAKSAQVSDIDELIVSPSGESVFAAAEQSPFGVMRYRGRWVVGVSETAFPVSDPARSHRSYDIALRRQMRRRFGFLPVDAVACPPKWTAVPSRMPEGAQWGIHSIFGYLPSRRMTSRFDYRHFRELSDSWKYARNGRLAFDPAVHETDTVLQHELSLVDWKR